MKSIKRESIDWLYIKIVSSARLMISTRLSDWSHRRLMILADTLSRSHVCPRGPTTTVNTRPPNINTPPPTTPNPPPTNYNRQVRSQH